jgi:Leucine-rich repeat (LRR) protein
MPYTSHEISCAFWYLGLGKPSGIYLMDLAKITAKVQRGTMTLATRIGMDPTVSSLQFEYQNLDKVPEEITQMPNLIRLELRGNNLQDLPSLCGLDKLSILDLRNNRFHTFPSAIYQLSPSGAGTKPCLDSLQVLRMSENYIVYLPGEIGRLVNLVELYLPSNRLTKLPPEIGQLTNLTILNLSENILTSLPAEIGNLTSLQELTVRKNSLVQLPFEIGNLSNLSMLDLRGNRLANLPSSIGNLTNLAALLLDDNNLQKLPDEIGGLIRCDTIQLENNRLTSLPASIGKLVSMSRLNVKNNQLTSLPAELGNLSQLGRLDISKNKLIDLPVELGQLTNTQILVEGNSLKFVPDQPSLMVEYEKATEEYTNALTELYSLQDEADENNSDRRFYKGSHPGCYELAYAPGWYAKYKGCLASINAALQHADVWSEENRKSHPQLKRLPPEIVGYIEQFY